MKKILFTILALLLIAGICFAGQLDRFSAIELKDLDSTVGSSKADGLYYKIIKKVVLSTTGYTLTDTERKAYMLYFSSGNTNSTKVITTGAIVSGRPYVIRNGTSGSGTTIKVVRTSSAETGVSVASGYTATVIYSSDVGGIVKVTYGTH